MTHPAERLVVVPVEPTDEMLKAGRGAAVPATQSIGAIYRAMLSAAPASPLHKGEPVSAIKGYACDGCGRLASDPAADLKSLRDQGAISCCPERKMLPVFYAHPLPAQESGGQWQPIETAPKDEPVLLFCPDRGCPSNRARIELGCASTSRGSHHSWATHWMPLPKAPEVTE